MDDLLEVFAAVAAAVEPPRSEASSTFLVDRAAAEWGLLSGATDDGDMQDKKRSERMLKDFVRRDAHVYVPRMGENAGKLMILTAEKRPPAWSVARPSVARGRSGRKAREGYKLAFLWWCRWRWSGCFRLFDQ